MTVGDFVYFVRSELERFMPNGGTLNFDLALMDKAKENHSVGDIQYGVELAPFCYDGNIQRVSFAVNCMPKDHSNGHE